MLGRAPQHAPLERGRRHCPPRRAARAARPLLLRRPRGVSVAMATARRHRHGPGPSAALPAEESQSAESDTNLGRAAGTGSGSKCCTQAFSFTKVNTERCPTNCCWRRAHRDAHALRLQANALSRCGGHRGDSSAPASVLQGHTAETDLRSV